MIGIHSGAVTHHQDQSITLVNLSTRNTKNKTLENDNPRFDTLLLFSIYFIFKFILNIHTGTLKLFQLIEYTSK